MRKKLVVWIILASATSFKLPLPPWRGPQQLMHIGPPGEGIDWFLSRFRAPEVMHVDMTRSNAGSNPPIPTIKSMYELPSPGQSDAVRVVLLSDTHGKHHCLRLPQADVLIHCGDVLLGYGYIGSEGAALRGLRHFDQWLGQQPAKHAVMIAGNHDVAVEGRFWRPTNAKLLHGTTIHKVAGLSIFGSPYSPPGTTSNDAFQQRDLGQRHAAVLNQEVDILVTHAKCPEFENAAKRFARVWAHGHFHNQYGIDILPRISNSASTEESSNSCLCVNAASCNMIYRPVNPPIVLDMIPSQK